MVVSLPKHTYHIVCLPWKDRSTRTGTPMTSTTRWCPPSSKLMISPLTINISPINHSYWSYVHQLSYVVGTTLYELSLTLRFIATNMSHGAQILHFFLRRKKSPAKMALPRTSGIAIKKCIQDIPRPLMVEIIPHLCFWKILRTVLPPNSKLVLKPTYIYISRTIYYVQNQLGEVQKVYTLW